MTEPTDSLSSLENLASRAAIEFANEFGGRPSWIAVAPGRVNLIGEHIDYNDGIVLPMAIERYTVMAGKRSSNQSKVQLFSKDLNDKKTLDLCAPLKPTERAWSNYVIGVIAEFLAREVVVPGFDAMILSSIPIGSGLSSSAALEVASATLLETLTNTKFSPSEKAILCQQAEHKFTGMPCGAMDQFASACGKLGHLIQLDCRDLSMRQIPFVTDQVVVLVINSHAQHALADGQYAIRRQQSQAALSKLGLNSYRDLAIPQLEQDSAVLTDAEFRRARHVVSETTRTIAASDAVSSGDWIGLGQLLNESHASLCDDYEVSCNELDILVQLAQDIGPAHGVFGARMTGGGFGGCTVNLVNRADCDAVTKQIQAAYQERTGLFPTAFATAPAAGTHVVVS